jgi:hypothetical protein
MVGRASSLLSWRAAAFVVLSALLGAYYATSEDLWAASDWWDTAFIAILLIPAVLGLVAFVLPAWRMRGTFLVGAAFGVAAFVLERADADELANFAKLGAMTFLAFWFLAFFETSSWVALVAAVIPWVDAWSVWRGPTREILTNREEIFGALSISFPSPGEPRAANLGLPDLLFFALFLAATERFGLRTRLTWLLMTASFGATMALALAYDTDGLPALPLLSAAFFLANGDLIWRRAREGVPTPDLSAAAPDSGQAPDLPPPADSTVPEVDTKS